MKTFYHILEQHLFSLPTNEDIIQSFLNLGFNNKKIMFWVFYNF